MASPLHWACDKGHVEVAKVLIKFGANLEIKTQVFLDNFTYLYLF